MRFVARLFGLALALAALPARGETVPAPHILVLSREALHPETPGKDQAALDSAVAKVLLQVLGRYHANLILDRDAVLIGADKIDVTSEALAQLQKEMPQADFPLVPLASIDAGAVADPRIAVLDKATVARTNPAGGADPASDTLRPILETLMQARGATLLLDRRAIAYGVSGFDLTPAVVQQLSSGAPGPAASASSAPLIAVIDLAATLKESTVGRGVELQVKDLTAKAMVDLKPQADALKKEAAALQQEIAGSGPGAHSAEVAAYAAKRQALEEEVKARQKAVELSVDAARLRIDNTVTPIVADLMRERGANLLIDRKAVVIANSTVFDITSETVTRLDKKLPSMKLEIGR